MSEAQLRAVKARYGVTFQEGALYSGLTVLQNVQLPMIEHLDLERDWRSMSWPCSRCAWWGCPRMPRPSIPSQLSGGMIKRAALARALALDPDAAVPRRADFRARPDQRGGLR